MTGKIKIFQRHHFNTFLCRLCSVPSAAGGLGGKLSALAIHLPEPDTLSPCLPPAPAPARGPPGGAACHRLPVVPGQHSKSIRPHPGPTPSSRALAAKGCWERGTQKGRALGSPSSEEARPSLPGGPEPT